MADVALKRPRGIQEVLALLTGVKKHHDYYEASCPAPGHKTPAGHLTLKDAGDKALVTCHPGRHGYEDICRALGFDSLTYGTNGTKPAVGPNGKLSDREAMALLKQIYGLTDATIDHFQIRPDYSAQAWRYPVIGGTRLKKYSRKPPMKYWHTAGTPNQLYGQADIPSGTAEVWLVNGEPGVWVMCQAGIPATCGIHGEGQLPADTVQQLKERGVQTINIPFDLDDAGRLAAYKDYEALKMDFGVKICQLPTEIGEKADVCDLYKLYGCDSEAFGHALLDLLEVNPAELENRSPDGENLTSAYREGSSEVRLSEVNAAALRAEGLKSGGSSLKYLPLLGNDGFIVEGWSHLLSAYPKSGKTTLLSHNCRLWSVAGEKVVYFTEEPQSVWEARLALSSEAEGWDRVELVFALGTPSDAILQRIAQGDESIVVVDTARLISLEDENNNSEVYRTLTPFIAKCRELGKTVIMAHHTRKMGGEYGLATAGAHAFLGIVDIALELHRDGASPNRRQLKGWGRVTEVPSIIYEKQDETLVPLGDPRAVELAQVQEQVRGFLTDDWQKTADILKALPDPKPSRDQISKALEELAKGKAVLRDPAIEEGSRPGMHYKWRLHLASDDPSFKVGGEVGPASASAAVRPTAGRQLGSDAEDTPLPSYEEDIP